MKKSFFSFFFLFLSNFVFAQKNKPNIILIYADDLGYGDLGFTGSKAIRTPNIDKLASQGVVLSNYHSASPVCSPSRAGLLTGRLPPRAAVPEDVRHGLPERPGDGGLMGRIDGRAVTVDPELDPGCPKRRLR